MERFIQIISEQDKIMKNKHFNCKGWLLALLIFIPLSAHARTTDLVSVSADIVEISGTLQTTIGFAWSNLLDFEEVNIPGLVEIGTFERKTALQSRLQLMESEGRAQVLSNPKVIVKTGESANISVGGTIPMPVVNNEGVGTSLMEYGVRLSVLPTILENRNKLIDLSVDMEVSQPDYSRPVVVGTSTVPSFSRRLITTRVELNSGETLVIGGLKSSSRNVAEGRVPFLGKLPVIGALFRSKDIVEEQRSMFLFLTVEIVE